MTPQVVAALPMADLVTDRAAVVLADRPVVALTRALADTAAGCARHGIELQLVTPPTARLTWPLEELLGADGARWVVQDVEGPAVDGLRGTPLHWDGAYTAGGPDVPAAEVDSGGGTVVDVSVRHAARADALLGGALEDALVALTGEPPLGWGVAEPAASRWDREALTRLCRDRAPARTLLVAVGRSDTAAGVASLATLTVRRVTAGLVERARLFAGHAEPPGAAALDALAATLAQHDVRSALVGLRPGRSDGTVAAGRSRTVLPVGLLVGAEGAGAFAVPGKMPGAVLGEVLGPPHRPAAWLRLDPGDPGAAQRALAHAVAGE